MKKKINIRLLRQVAKQISEEPRRLDMNVLTDLRAPEDAGNPPCGTVGCIAGWSCVLSGSRPKPLLAPTLFWGKGRRLLGLTEVQGERLFNVPADAIYEQERVLYGVTDKREPHRYWPIKFAKRYAKAKTPRGRMLATVARIEHFIATKGAE